MINRIGRYTIIRKLGEGGMGVVYAAHDPRLERSVAIKTVRDGGVDDTARQRLWREARAAAKVSHPNVCQLYEIGEEDGTVFLAMELLEGENLADRIAARGSCSVEECVQLCISILAALEALHSQGILHRDLKPSNVFLTPVGVKLVDFGLARPIVEPGAANDMAITQAGTLHGTPRYMAPELWREDVVGPTTDLFSVGALLYELLTGQPAFPGHTMIEVYESILTHEPPPLGGSAAAARLDQVIQRALRKKPHERFPTASVMAAALRDVQGIEDTGERIAPRRMVRLLGLPLRVLRSDPETDFLAFSLPDAVSSSLSGLGSLAVRSSAVAARFASGDLDLAKIASEAEVDVVLSGTLMRAGDQLRVTAQLLEAPAGTVLWSQTFQTSIDDLFTLQDALTERIVESLSVPLSSRERAALRHDAPASAQAYEFYLRANQLAYDAKSWELARDLYLKCLELDPEYAPAWARLGRLHRAISVYTGKSHAENSARAQEAFRKALQLNPDLSIAHSLYAYLEVEMGQAKEAMLRLLGQARFRMHDPELFAGLVHALRYCGLLDESIAAYQRAHRVDPGIRSSVAHAYFMRGDNQAAIDTNLDDPPFVTFLAMEQMGRKDEVIAMLREREGTRLPRFLADLILVTRTLIEGNFDASRPVIDRLVAEWRSPDPCSRYYVTRYVSRMGDVERAVALLRRTVDDGLYTPSFFRTDPWLDPLRGNAEFESVLRRADERCAEARRAFTAAGGERILGLGV